MTRNDFADKSSRALNVLAPFLIIIGITLIVAAIGGVVYWAGASGLAPTHFYRVGEFLDEITLELWIVFAVAVVLTAVRIFIKKRKR